MGTTKLTCWANIFFFPLCLCRQFRKPASLLLYLNPPMLYITVNMSRVLSILSMHCRTGSVMCRGPAILVRVAARWLCRGRGEKKNRLAVCWGPSITIYLSKCQFGEPREMCWLHSNLNVFASSCFLWLSVQSNVGSVPPYLLTLLVSFISTTLVTVLFFISVLLSHNSWPVFKNVLSHSIWINYVYEQIWTSSSHIRCKEFGRVWTLGWDWFRYTHSGRETLAGRAPFFSSFLCCFPIFFLI